MSDYREDNLKKAAELYAEAYGKSLLSEHADMQAQNVRYLTPRADDVVRKLSRVRNRAQRRRNIGVLAAVAASLVIAIAIPSIMDQTTTGPSTSVPSSPDMAADIPSDTGPTPPPSQIDWTVMQPLSFTLPDEFKISSSELDNGMSIYRLSSNSDLYPDDVVLTMQQPEGDEVYLDTEIVYIDSKAVNTKIDDGYMMLLFEKDEKLYTLSCRDDMGALTYMYRCIEGEQI